MSYVRAEEILPEDLIKAIQQYVRNGEARQKPGSIIGREMKRSVGNMRAEFQ